MTDDRTQALVDEAAAWAVDHPELHAKVKPLAEHFAEVANLMFAEAMIMMAKALEAGIYFGKFGFPEDRVPDAFKDAFKEGGDETTKR